MEIISKKYFCRFCNNNNYKIIYKFIKDWEYGVDGEYAYNRCIRCRGIQIDPFPTIKELIKAYEIDYHGYQESANKGIIYRLLQGLLDMNFYYNFKGILKNNSRVLDIGCGSGVLLEKIRQNGINDITGIDFSKKSIEIVKSKGINCFHGLFEDYKCSKGYDLIVMNNYIEHTTNPRIELQKAFSMLNTDGVIYGEIPCFDSWERKIFRRYWGGNHVPRHTFQFDQLFFIQLLTNVGFKKIKIKHQLNTAHIAISIQNICNNMVGERLKLNHGRVSWFNFLLLFLIPFNIIPVLLKKSGVIKFTASK